MSTLTGLAKGLSVDSFPVKFPCFSLYMEWFFQSISYFASTLSSTCSNSFHVVPTLTCKALHGGPCFHFDFPSHDSPTLPSHLSAAVASCWACSRLCLGASVWALFLLPLYLQDPLPYFSSVPRTASSICIKPLTHSVLSVSLSLSHCVFSTNIHAFW